MGIRRRSGSKKKSSGPLGGGCALWLAAIVGWAISAAIFPKLPDYEKTLEKGELQEGTVLRVENVENISINDRHPKRVHFEYGDDRQGSMILAMKERASKGQEIKVRVLGDQAYPVGLDPLAKPGWVNLALLAALVIGSLLLVFGILRLAVIGGALFAGGRALLKQHGSSGNSSGPPPPPGPFPPPPPPQ